MTRVFIFYILFFLAFLTTTPACSQNKSTSAFTNVEKLLSTGRALYKQQDYDQAMKIFSEVKKELNGIKSNNDATPFNSKVQRYIGDIHFKKEQFTDAIRYYESSLPYIHSHNDDRLKSHIFHKLSLCYSNLGMYEEAFDYENQNLQYISILNDTISLWEANYQLGKIMSFNKDIPQALEYFHKSLDLSDRIQIPTYKYTSIAAIGFAYHQADSTIHLSIDWGQKALDFAKKIQYPAGIASAYANISDNYFGLQEYGLAENYALKAIEIQDTLNNKWELATSYALLSEIYLKKKEYRASEGALQKGLALAEAIKAQIILKDLYYTYSKLKGENNDFKSSKEYLEKYIAVKSSIEDLEFVQRLNSKRILSEVNKKNKLIDELTEKQRIDNIRLKYLIYASVLSILTLLGASWGFYSQWKIRKKLSAQNELIEKNNLKLGESNRKLGESNSKLEESNKKLEEFNIKLEESNNKLESTNAKLGESNKELEQFAYIASHDMREPIRTIGSFSSLIRRKYKESLGDSGLELIDFVIDASGRLDRMLMDLLSYSRVNTKNQEKALSDLNQIAEGTILSLQYKLEEENATVNISNALPTSVMVNEIQMERLFQNLIANGIKYNESESKTINISSTEEEDRFVIKVADNGIGIAEEYHQEVFEIFRRLHKIGEYEGSGIGLSTCKKIVEKHGGEIWIASEKGKGTTILFSLPKVA